MKKNIVAYLIAYIVVVIAVTIFSQVRAQKIIGNGFPQNTLIVHYNQGEGDKAASEIQAAGISRNAIEDTKNITVHRASILVSLPFRSIYWFIILGIFVAVAEFAKKFLVRSNQADSTI
jgi:hypothetical protein